MFGEEAHIVSGAPAGPRAGDIADHDEYSNLILLCSKDHKRVDDQVAHYTVELLVKIKRDHEDWIASLDGGRTRLVPDPMHPVAKTLLVCMSGSAVWDLAQGAMGFRPSWPASLSEEQRDLVAAFLDDLRDWIDAVSEDSGYQAGREAAKHLDEHIKALTGANLLVGVRERHCLLTGGPEPPFPWRMLDIQIQSLSIAQVVSGDGAQIWPPEQDTPPSH